jgi:hypothetical protein
MEAWVDGKSDLPYRLSGPSECCRQTSADALTWSIGLMQVSASFITVSGAAGFPFNSYSGPFTANMQGGQTDLFPAKFLRNVLG